VSEHLQDSKKANRLYEVTQRIGFALWQLQELEGVLAQYYVLVALAKRGMGLDAGNVLLVDAQRKTFGATIQKLVKAKLLPSELESRFTVLLKERNWLVHSSRSTSRDAVHNDAALNRTVSRVDVIADEAQELLRAVGIAAEDHVVELHSISMDEINRMAADILKSWQDNDEN